MLKQACVVCKIVGIFAILGALNLGVLGVSNVNLIDKCLGTWPLVVRVLYGVIGLSGLAFLASYFCTCPACKKEKS